MEEHAGLKFIEYNDILFESLLSSDPNRKLSNLTQELYVKGHTKNSIYLLFLEFHKAIQIDPRTKDRKDLYDILSDFMDTLID